MRKKIPIEKRERNILRCGTCGTEVLTSSPTRQCFKCGADMILINKKWKNKY